MARERHSSPPLAGLPPVGELIAAKYRLERYMRAGRMGVVASAVRVDGGDLVAIKFLRPELSEQERAVERFLREARTARTVLSEHICRVVDVGRLEEGTPFMVMEHVDGIDLHELLRRDGPLPIDDAVDYTLQAAEAIAEAHSLGVVHRDLKTSNLLLGARPDGSPVVKVIDFGVAKLLEDADTQNRITRTGKIVGTPVYWSPEQIRDSRDVDGRTDVWGLGGVLYELLAGRPPFHAKGMMALVAKIIGDRQAPVTTTRSDIPTELAEVVDRCLEKDRTLRYPTISAVAQALARFAPPRSQPCLARIEALGV
jgi:serine/threonine-protein kinase